jgi:membrane associated rhomboid family serine protease
VIINLLLTFVISSVSLGGHLGGLFGGMISMMLLLRFGRSGPALTREGLTGIAALVAVGLVSVLIAYARVRGLA